MSEQEREAIQRDLQKLADDARKGILTTELPLRSPAASNTDHILAEILRLNRMIDAEPMGERHTDLCAAFRALNWARSPESYAPSSECVLP